ncbi:hypothetical protein KSF73_10370 [Burkholderiaceae bacterium DAT-1]|nr:hypothetical protein [Burkholderiaceae bacterium DAT-1]
MNNAGSNSKRGNGEPDTGSSLSKLMKEPPATREQHAQRMAKRGDVRRRLEDLMLEKASQDLW